ncbi:peptide ABC transporter permease [Pontibacillus halophilus JSM 076056 = DSM 19796]|uniref:Peptide ABC transporter permease n=1 Tax=Pontibacillus halophilus JSM 076056 = DSM 19796 TaxID=1385510 RepID=A0A0A5GHE5_9BACI|nr:oligopeptide ABC transporter permease [Pontibacillus halophilus]KGX92691.1 peptide ABC transporter permease [Pontibacillus halophilus JSM 076056 = DSM 19796]
MDNKDLNTNVQPNKDLFVPVERRDGESEQIGRPSLTFWKDSWMRLKKNTGAIIGLIMLLVVVFMALVGPLMNSYSSTDQNVERSKLPPRIQGLENVGWLPFTGLITEEFEAANVMTAEQRATLRFGSDEEYKEVEVLSEGGNGEMAKIQVTYDPYAAGGFEEDYFWFGSDKLGRDQWTRIWEGTQISLLIALVAAFIDMVIGVAYGGISGYYGGRVDNTLQRIIEILTGIPNLVIVILMILVLGSGIVPIIIALTITGWTSMARIVRGQILKLKSQEFVLASKTLGSSDSRILRKHLIPNVTGLIVINTMFTIPSAIFFEAFLSFIGLGLQPPDASLGTLIDGGFDSLQTHPFLLIYPAIVISLIMIGFNILADGLRDALDPKMRD